MVIVIPDCFDLNDWIMQTYPEVYRATFYLHPDTQYQVWLEVWHKVGSPVIE